MEINEVSNQIFEIVFELSTVAITFAGTFMIIENSDPMNAGQWEGDRNFLQSFYFIVVTFFTVGYGDIAPTTNLGMLLMVAFVLVYIGYRFTTRLSALIILMTSTSPYDRAQYKSDADTKFIVISGYVQASTLDTVVNEYLHDDHNDANNQGRKAVIFQENEPPIDLQMLLYRPDLQHKLTYVKGSTMSPDDCLRVSLA